MPAYVNHLAYALGEETHSLQQVAEEGRLVSAPEALKDAGFALQHRCGLGSTAFNLALKAALSLREHLGNLHAIIYATALPLNANQGDPRRFQETRDVKYLMDFPASRLQAALDLHNAAVFGLDQQACTGLLGSLRLARAILSAEPDMSPILCVTADRFPPEAIYEQAYNLVSDGAAACIVSGEPQGFRILACHGVTNGALVQASDDQTVGTYFSYAHRVVRETLAKAGIEAAAVDWIVPQNTNGKAWRILSGLLGIDPARVYAPSIGDVGHVISADNIINLKLLEASGEAKPGHKVLLFMAGYGMNWQCTLLERV